MISSRSPLEEVRPLFSVSFVFSLEKSWIMVREYL
jgi:hypothetical protein